MAKAQNEAYYELLDDLTEQKFFGDVTLHFQNGVIESSHLSERNTKYEIKEMMQSRRRRKGMSCSLGASYG